MPEPKRKPRPNQARWTAIAVQRETKARLDDLRNQWTEWSGRQLTRPLDGVGIADTEESTKGEVGYDRVVRRLIALVEDHRARARRAGRAE